MKNMIYSLPALGLLFQTALAVGNPSTGDNNIVGIALIAGGVALVLLVVMLVVGKKKK